MRVCMHCAYSHGRINPRYYHLQIMAGHHLQGLGWWNGPDIGQYMLYVSVCMYMHCAYSHGRRNARYYTCADMCWIPWIWVLRGWIWGPDPGVQIWGTQIGSDLGSKNTPKQPKLTFLSFCALLVILNYLSEDLVDPILDP